MGSAFKIWAITSGIVGGVLVTSYQRKQSLYNSLEILPSSPSPIKKPVEASQAVESVINDKDDVAVDTDVQTVAEHVAEISESVSSTVVSNERSTARVAIIGSGVGGATACHFLK